MNDHGEVSAAAVVSSLTFDRTATQLRFLLGGSGLFFVAVFAGAAVAIGFVIEPAAAIWVIPVSLALGIGITIAFARWGALSMMAFVADEHLRVRAVLGAPGIRRLSRKLGSQAYLRNEFLLGLAIVVIYLLIAVLVPLTGLGVNGATAVLALPMLWIGSGAGFFMIRAGLRIHPEDTPLESNVAAPLAAAYLLKHGGFDELTTGIPADKLVSNITDSDMENIDRVSSALARIRHLPPP